jgi:hypothetical protein
MKACYETTSYGLARFETTYHRLGSRITTPRRMLSAFTQLHKRVHMRRLAKSSKPTVRTESTRFNYGQWITRPEDLKIVF